MKMVKWSNKNPEKLSVGDKIYMLNDINLMIKNIFTVSGFKTYNIEAYRNIDFSKPCEVLRIPDKLGLLYRIAVTKKGKTERSIYSYSQKRLQNLFRWKVGPAKRIPAKKSKKAQQILKTLRSKQKTLKKNPSS